MRSKSSESHPRIKYCGLCHQILNARPEARDCGGDCLQCMAELAEDPDCIEELIGILRKKLENFEKEYL